ncbi:MAG TPA: flagellar basal body L-ring protein [Holosporales bacterium]|nr:flagellar basal body L-ring protein [Holosporales bacterium]
MLKNHKRMYALSLLACLLLNGCLAEKMSEIVDGPRISQIQNPTMAHGYAPVSMPMPAPTQPEHHINSLWQIGSKAFFKDQRAGRIGDIVTVAVLIDNKESTNFTPSMTKETKNDRSITNFLGLEHQVKRILPHKFSDNLPEKWLNFASKPSHTGSGKYNLEDKMKFTISATIIQIMPNGNLVIQGHTEFKLMNEVREVELRGIVRRSDIQSNNSISSDKIAELRIVYAGRGDITDVANKPWGIQAVEKIMPF